MIIRQRVFVYGAMLLLSVALTSSAIAQVTTPGTFLPANSDLSDGTNGFGDPIGTRVEIPDFDPNLAGGAFPAVNTLNTTFSTVTITQDDLDARGDNGQDIVDVFFTIEGLTHSHASDLTVSVAYTPEGATGATRTATLFERVGILDGGSGNGANGFVDNQNGDGFGSNANLNGSYRFADRGTQLFAQAATSTGDNAVVPVLDPITGVPIYQATGATDQQVGLFSAFATDGNGNALQLVDIIGEYTFAISDRSNQTTNVAVNGTEQSFTRTNVAFQTAAITAIPEPGTASAMLLGLIGLAARRRRA